LAILKVFSNTDKHRSLVLHVTHVEPRVHITVIHPTGSRSDSDSRDDGAAFTIEVPPDSEFVDIVNVQRRLSSFVAFAQWGDTGQNIGVVAGLQALVKNVRTIVNEFEAFTV